MSNQQFHKIALMGRSGIVGMETTLIAVQDYLLSLNYQVVLEESTAPLIPTNKLTTVTASELSRHAELVIVVGGDGSLINAAHIAVMQGLPVLGINRGRLGFLTDINPDELTSIHTILQGKYRTEERFFLEATITHDNTQLAQSFALNDVVLLPGDIAQMIEFDIFIDDIFVCNQRADGLIIATPTGSTAYALSGGGPIIHPQLDATVLVPMFPHKLSSRPIVIKASSTIRLAISKTNTTKPYVSCDGQQREIIPPSGELTINKKAQTLKLIHPKDYDYYTTLREKLGWEKQLPRKRVTDQG